MRYASKPKVEVEGFQFKRAALDAGIQDPLAKGYAPFPEGIHRRAFVIDGRTVLKTFIDGPDGPQFLGVDDYIVTDEFGRYTVDQARFEAHFKPQEEK